MSSPAERTWSIEDAERYLLGLELFGMRFGLDRMRRLMTALGLPQEQFRSIHIVGTNGKSSTARMTSAILERHGVRTGTYLSPHLVSFTERIRIGDVDVAPERFAAAVARAARAADKVDRTLEGDDHVTQFEALTAAAYSEMAEAGVEVAVVEAGLGGRYDATNVIPSEVQVLTNVGLEHTRWLGPTIRDIASEKLAVVTSSGDRRLRRSEAETFPSTLVVGPDLHPDALELALATPARIVVATDTDMPIAARGAFQRRNFALARAAAEALLGELDDDAVRAAAASTLVPGRFELVGESPETVIDGAHNPAGMAALVESLPEWLDGRELTAVVSVLDDKDAAGMLQALIPHVTRIVCTTNANPRALPPATLKSLARQLGFTAVTAERDPRAALAIARELSGPQGAVLATGSIYLIADLLRPAGTRGATL
ncbi:MAG: dihydrofolate synthase / folylpolyglutamate synthase [Solirubrobacteraceae bacterium]|nr:dihydrofolate synthase / folylpolyglutamate synthase [Solirubrobacteraceae bacterium]